jgi:hypothetical protein
VTGGGSIGLAISYNTGLGSWTVLTNLTQYTSNGAHTPVPHQWYHFAISRSGTSLKFFINGVQYGATQTNSQNITGSTQGITIGAQQNLAAPFLVNGWMKNIRISNSARYTAPFAPLNVNALFVDDANTKLLLLGDESIGATTFIDSEASPKTVTTNGNVVLQSINADLLRTNLLLHCDDAATYPLTGAILLDGTGDYLTNAAHADFNFRTGDFTLEGWFRFTSLVTNTGLMDLGDFNGTGKGISWRYALASQFECRINSTNIGTITLDASFVTDRWYHLAIVRAGGVFRHYVDGRKQGADVINNDDITGTGTCYYGFQNAAGVSALAGYMKNIRVSNTARYLFDFTPTQTPFVADSNTVMLILANESVNAVTFVDSETSPKTLTTVGQSVLRFTEDYRNQSIVDASVTPTGTFIPAMKFDSSGDYLTTPDHADFRPGTGQFSIELWAKWKTLDGAMTFFDSSNAAGGSGIFFGYHPSTPGLSLYLNTGGASVSDLTFVPVINRWYHLAVTRDANNVCRIFVNGKLKAAAVDADNISASAQNPRFPVNTVSYNNFKGWFRNYRFSNTARYTAPFVPPALTTDLVDDANTKLLLTGTIPSWVGSRTKAIRFDGTGDYLTTADSADWDFGTGDFTLEGWYRPSTVASHVPLSAGTAGAGYYLEFDGAGTVQFADQGVARVSGSFTPVANRWYHFAVARSGTSLKLFIDGVQLGSATYSGSLSGGTTGMYIGARTTPDKLVNGWLKQIRVSNIARYTAAFNPSEVAFTNDANTKLLILAEEAYGATTFVDSEGSPKTITTVGDCVIVPVTDYRNRQFTDREATPKFMTVTGDSIIDSITAVEGQFARPVLNQRAKLDFISAFGTGSLNLDGSTKWLRMEDHNDFALGSTWTIDWWFKFNAVGGRVCGQFVGAGDYWYPSFETSQFKFNYNGVEYASSSFTPILDNWYHFELACSAGTLKAFINGREVASTGSVPAVSNKAAHFEIGELNLTVWMNGYMDNLRISNIARHNASFNPPTVEYALGTVLNMDLRSIAFVAEAQPATARLIVFEQDVDAAVVNTDILGYVSRDNGSTWNQVTLVDEGDYETGKRILAANVTLTSSGTNMKWRVTTPTGKDVYIHGVSTAWRT